MNILGFKFQKKVNYLVSSRAHIISICYKLTCYFKIPMLIRGMKLKRHVKMGETTVIAEENHYVGFVLLRISNRYKPRLYPNHLFYSQHMTIL